MEILLCFVENGMHLIHYSLTNLLGNQMLLHGSAIRETYLSQVPHVVALVDSGIFAKIGSYDDKRDYEQGMEDLVKR